MRKETHLGNKGFSLVELIIVIAIMAILVGVLAPNLMRYIERANVAADTQTANTIRTAFLTAIMDPQIDNGNLTGFAANQGARLHLLNSAATFGGDDFGAEVAITIGFVGALDAGDPFRLWEEDNVRQNGVTNIMVRINADNEVAVRIGDATAGPDIFLAP